jgi:SAM-dependent methyltransferase
LYRTRGLSSDTSLFPNFAIEESLKQIKTRGLFAPGSIRRVAVVGPGLDFTDKQEGYDFYPQQTIQPFAIMDTLMGLGLANPAALRVTTFDLSPRVNDHLARAKQRAQRGQSYMVQPEVNGYWERFGNQIGVSVLPVPVPAGAGELKVRAVRIRPDIVSRITPFDLNIVAQRMEAPESEAFDLIIATNILVYYDTFEQSLAMNNVEHMLRPGGILLSNNALLELPFFRLHSVGYTTAIYSDREGDGDHIVWYRRAPD